MILKLLLNTQMMWMMFKKILKNTIQTRNTYYGTFMMMWLLIAKKLYAIVTELFISVRKPNISLAFITQSYFAVPENIRQNSKHYFIMKIPNKLMEKYKKVIQKQ